MLRLLLLRHAKSSWADPGLADRDRPLSGRGERAAPAMGRHIAEHDLVPERVLCSGARRARQTLAHVLAALPREAEVEYSEALYGGDAWDILALARARGDTASPLLVIGHNPAMAELATGLLEPGGPGIEGKFATGALAVIDLPIDAWSELDLRKGRLAAFVQPRDLA